MPWRRSYVYGAAHPGKRAHHEAVDCGSLQVKVQKLTETTRSLATGTRSTYRGREKCHHHSEGHGAATGIAREFADHRTHHANVICSFADGKLILIAENDFDPKELALMDEFSDCLSAYISTPFDGELVIQAVVSF